jgi:hypothetical protein
VITGGSVALGAADPGRRLRFVQRRLDADAQRVRIWAWSWAGIYSSLVVINGVRLIRSTKRGDIIDNTVATAGSAFGLLVLSIMPPAVLRDEPKLARIVSRYGTDDDCVVLAAAEKILLRDAASEAFGKGPLVHAGNFAFNMALGVLIGAYFHRWTTAMIVAPVAIAVGELQTMTVVTHIRDTLALYREGQLDSTTARSKPTWTLMPQLGRDQIGLGLGVKF